jgi:tetratricopeptide (TPR) repeat protein
VTTPHATGSGRRRAPASALPLLATLTALAALSGCGYSPFGGPADVTRDTAETPGGRNPATLADVRARAEFEPTQAFWPYRLGVLYADADSLGAAEQTLRRALTLSSHHAPSLALLARIYFEQGRHAEAIRDLEAARASTAAFPNGLPAPLLEALALHYDAVDRIDDARAAIAAAGDDAGAGSPRVYLQLRGEASADAGAIAERAAKRAPKSAANHNNLGIARLRAGDAEGAAEAFATAIDLDADLPGPYYNMAILEKFYRLNDDAARGWFRKYRQRANADPDHLAQILDPAGTTPVAERKEQP